MGKCLQWEQIHAPQYSPQGFANCMCYQLVMEEWVTQPMKYQCILPGFNFVSNISGERTANPSLVMCLKYDRNFAALKTHFPV